MDKPKRPESTHRLLFVQAQLCPVDGKSSSLFGAFSLETRGRWAQSFKSKDWDSRVKDLIRLRFGFGASCLRKCCTLDSNGTGRGAWACAAGVGGHLGSRTPV